MKNLSVKYSCFSSRRRVLDAMCAPWIAGFEVKVLSGLVISMMAGIASGQALEGMAIEVGETKVVPAIGVEYVFTDNVFLAPDNEIESSGVRLTPSVQWMADKGSLSVTAAYSGDFADYDEDSLDYDDHSIGLGVKAVISKRLRTDASIGIDRTHEELGTNLTRGISTVVDDQVVFNNARLNASATYGAAGAKGNLKFGLGYRSHTATNLKQLAESSEYELLSPFVEFSLRVSPDTRLVFGVEYSRIDYEVDFRDRDAYTFLTGLSFAPTGKLSGSFRVGFSEVDYKSDTNADTNEFVLNASLQYVPADHSRFSLSANREFDLDRGSDNDVTGQETISDRLALGWRYEWSSRVYHQVGVGYSASTRDCPASSTDTTSASISLNYYLKRWLEVGAFVSADSREGDLCSADPQEQGRLDYDRQKYGIGFRATL